MAVKFHLCLLLFIALMVSASAYTKKERFPSTYSRKIRVADQRIRLYSVKQVKLLAVKSVETFV